MHFRVESRGPETERVTQPSLRLSQPKNSGVPIPVQKMQAPITHVQENARKPQGSGLRKDPLPFHILGQAGHSAPQDDSDLKLQRARIKPHLCDLVKPPNLSELHCPQHKLGV